MKKTVLSFLFAAVACDSVPRAEFQTLNKQAAHKDELAALDAKTAKKEDLQALEEKLFAKLQEELAPLRVQVDRLDAARKNLDETAKRVDNQRVEVDKQLVGISKIAGDVLSRAETANTNVLKSLEVQAEYLKKLLADINTLVESLKK